MPQTRRTALVTGASVGIGYELAKRFARDRFDLVLVARDKERLDKVAAELQNTYGTDSRVLAMDLARPGAPDEIFASLEGRTVDVLVNNAGYTTYGAFASVKAKDDLDLLQVNVGALVHLTKLFLAPMLERRSGKIWNVSSVAAFTPGPYQSTYYASKAFVQSFTEALHAELQGTGVTVTAVCPGATRTEFHKRANMKQAHAASQALVMSAADVARIGYEAGMAGRRTVITGWANNVLAFAAKRIVPVGLALSFVEKLNRNRELK